MATSVTETASTQEKLLRARSRFREAGYAFQQREECVAARDRGSRLMRM